MNLGFKFTNKLQLLERSGFGAAGEAYAEEQHRAWGHLLATLLWLGLLLGGDRSPLSHGPMESCGDVAPLWGEAGCWDSL